LKFVFVVLFLLSSYFLFVFVCRWPHSLGNSPGSKRVTNGLSGAMSPERLSVVVSSAVHAAVAHVQAAAEIEDDADGDIVDGADGSGGEALGVWTFQEDDKFRPVSALCTCTCTTQSDRARQDDHPDAADMLWLNDSQEKLCVTVLFT